MHRGFRKTETNAVNKSPFAGSFTAIVEPAEPRGPARVTRAVRMTADRRQNVRESFIPPPINESAIVEPVCPSQRISHLRLRAQRKERQAPQFLPTSRYSRRCAFQSLVTRSYERSEERRVGKECRS